MTDETGQHVRFRMSTEQRQVLALILSGRMRLVILKARQVGMTTFMALFALDTCLFSSNKRCGIIDKKLEDAKRILKDKILYAYAHLPPIVKQLILQNDGTGKGFRIGFSNGSAIEIGTSLRGGTFHVLHVTEFAKISRRFPEVALEIKNGAFNAVHKGQVLVVESTGEGRGGLYYDLWKKAVRLRKGRLSALDWTGIFFAWFNDRRYVDLVPIEVPRHLAEYFSTIEATNGIRLADPQRWWYVRKWHEQGERMRQEFPSTPDEAFSGHAEGTYLAEQLNAMELAGHITAVPPIADVPVITLWEMGNDLTAVWLMQRAGERRRLIGYHEAPNATVQHHLAALNGMRQELGLTWAAHLIPHLGGAKAMEEQRTFAHYVRGLGEDFPGMACELARPIEPEGSYDYGMQWTRHHMLISDFDRERCEVGLERLRDVSQEWVSGHWSGRPRKDKAWRAANALRVGSFIPRDLVA